jgi:hypothetical protein
MTVDINADVFKMAAKFKNKRTFLISHWSLLLRSVLIKTKQMVIVTWQSFSHQVCLYRQHLRHQTIRNSYKLILIFIMLHSVFYPDFGQQNVSILTSLKKWGMLTRPWLPRLIFELFRPHLAARLIKVQIRLLKNIFDKYR